MYWSQLWRPLSWKVKWRRYNTFMKSVRMFGGVDTPLPESIDDLNEILKNHEPHKRNVEFYRKAVSLGTNKSFYILIEFVKNGTSGAYQAHWQNGLSEFPIVSVRWDFDPMLVHNHSKDYLDIENVFTHALCGVIDYIHTSLLFSPVLPLSDQKIRFKFMVEPALKAKLGNTIKFVNSPKRWKCISPHLFGVHTLLWDQKCETRFEIISLDIYNKHVWNRDNVYKAREDCYEMALGNRSPDYTVHSLEEMLCTRKMNEYRSNDRIDIGNCYYKWLNEYSINQGFGPG